MKIPVIDFREHESIDDNIEVIELDSLYNRLPTLAHNPSTPHRIGFYCLIYITKGSGTHFIDFNNYPYEESSFIFLHKNQVHAFDLINRPQGKAILFTQAFVDSIGVNIRVPIITSNLIPSYAPVITVNQSLKESSEAMFLEINKEIESPNRDNLIIQLLVSVLLLKIPQERDVAYNMLLSEKQAINFSHFISLLEQKYMITRDASMYAEMMGMTYKSLNKICKLACKQTTKQLIDTRVILEAKRKLAVEKIQVQQLAFELGFEEVTNFTKFFKRHTLITPFQFKENSKG